MHRGLKIAVLIAGTLLGIWFLLAGSMKFMARPAFDEMFARLGVPLGMVPLTGALEVLGGSSSSFLAPPSMVRG